MTISPLIMDIIYLGRGAFINLLLEEKFKYRTLLANKKLSLMCLLSKNLIVYLNKLISFRQHKNQKDCYDQHWE